MIEDGVYLAARALTDERKQRLAYAVAHGIAVNDQYKLTEKRILAIIGELDDGDVLLLEAYAGDRPRDKIENQRPEQPVAGAPAEANERWQLYLASLAQLERLGVLQHNVSVDSYTGVPKFDRFSGKPTGIDGIFLEIDFYPVNGDGLHLLWLLHAALQPVAEHGGDDVCRNAADHRDGQVDDDRVVRSSWADVDPPKDDCDAAPKLDGLGHAHAVLLDEIGPDLIIVGGDLDFHYRRSSTEPAAQI